MPIGAKVFFAIYFPALALVLWFNDDYPLDTES